MLTLLAGALPALLGFLTAAVPQLIKWLERGQQYKHEQKLTELRIEAAREGLDSQIFLESLKAAADEAKALREHDTAIPTHRYINYLRSSVRPVITYIVFFAFIIFKAILCAMMFIEGETYTAINAAVWDNFAIGVLGVIVGFWFGTRTFMHNNKQIK